MTLPALLAAGAISVFCVAHAHAQAACVARATAARSDTTATTFIAAEVVRRREAFDGAAVLKWAERDSDLASFVCCADADGVVSLCRRVLLAMRSAVPEAAVSRCDAKALPPRARSAPVQFIACNVAAGCCSDGGLRSRPRQASFQRVQRDSVAC